MEKVGQINVECKCKRKMKIGKYENTRVEITYSCTCMREKTGKLYVKLYDGREERVNNI